jgi:glycosyltransferase A (GT-A) superfamily protein (DUF2064 family)
VVPAWNEAAAIEQVVHGLRQAGACCVYVVDPGSTDGTPELALAAGAEVIREPRPGYGRACSSGAQAAIERDHELLAFLDGDGSCDPSDLPSLVAAAEGADVVLGRRRRIARGALPWHARLGNRLVAEVLRLRCGAAAHDLPPFKLLRADALRNLALDDPGYGWTVQLVSRALAHPGLRIVEEPVRFDRRMGGVSKVSGQLVPSLRAGRGMLERAWSAGPRGALVLMAKAPGAGHSKTRLERELGEEVVAGFWTACLRDSGARLRTAAGAACADALAMTPSPAEAAIVRQLTGLPALAQLRPGLGAALLQVSELAGPFTIAVSADVPTLPVERLLEAVAAVRSGHTVLGPGPDGGYYLVGLPRGVDRGSRIRAFLNAPLGSQGAFDHARAALSDVQALEPWADVDTEADLAVLVAELQREPALAPALAAWVRDRWESVEGARSALPRLRSGSAEGQRR